MRVFHSALMLAAVLTFPLLLAAQPGFPRMITVEPATAKVGEIVTVAGENLDKENVAEVLMTDNKNDFKVQITEQAATALKFKVPESVSAGRFGLVIRTPSSPGNAPKEYLQPVKVTIQ